MTRLRIAFLVNRFPVLTETFILNQITGLLDRGHQVDIIARSAASPEPVQPAVRHRGLDRRVVCLHIPRDRFRRRGRLLLRLPFLVARHPVAVLRIAAVFARDPAVPIVDALYFLLARPRVRPDYDIVHGQFGSLGAIAVLLRDAGVLRGSVVTSFRGYDLSLHLRRYGRRVYRRLLARGDLFLASCDFHRARLIAELGAPEDRVVVHRSGIDLARFDRPPRPDRAAAPVRFLIVGRLVEKKGVEYAIRALARAARAGSDLEGTIIGDGPLKAELEALARTLGVEDRLRFLGGRHHEGVIEQLDRAAFLVAPSVTAGSGDQEGIPNALKEAMAAGRPVVATRHAGIPELVEDGVSGHLVPERDVEALAARMRDLAACSARRAAMGQAGRLRVRRDYDADALNDELADRYRRLREAPAARGSAAPGPRPDIAIFLLWVGGGGKETVIRHLAGGFVDAGYRVDLVVGDAATAYRDKIPERVRLVDLETRGYARATIRLAFYLLRHRPRVIFSTLPFSAIPAIAARYLSCSRARLVVRVCNNLTRRFEFEPEAFPRGVRVALRFLPRLANRVVACSTGIAREIAGITRIPFDRIRILYNPAITAAMQAAAAEPLEHPWFAASPGGAVNPPVILGVGRLARQKNFALLIRAFAAVRKETEARLLILGEGPERPALERLVEDLDLAAWVSLPGYVTNPYAYLARARVFALSSSWEGFANVIVEALALGTPVVATDCPSGPAEVLDGGRFGILVPVGDEAAMASGIQRILRGDPPEVTDDWLRRFTVEDVARRYLDLFGLPETTEARP